MSALQVALPKHLKSFVDDRAAEAGCTSSAFVKQVLENYQRNEELKQLKEMLMTGIRQLDRGEGREMTQADWDRLHARIAKKAKGRKK